MNEDKRLRFFERLVMGLALVLIVIVGYYAFEKIASRRKAAPLRPMDENAEEPSGIRKLKSSGTERAVNRLPPMQISRTAGLRSPKAVVPPPNKKE